MKPEDFRADAKRPLTGEEYLKSLQDGREIYIYGEREYHGARLVILHENTPAEYDTEMLYYKDLVSEPLPGGLTPIHGKYVENIVIAAAAGLLVLIGAGVLVGVRIAKRKKRSQK